MFGSGAGLTTTGTDGVGEALGVDVGAGVGLFLARDGDRFRMGVWVGFGDGLVVFSAFGVLVGSGVGSYVRTVGPERL